MFFSQEYFHSSVNPFQKVMLSNKQMWRRTVSRRTQGDKYVRRHSFRQGSPDQQPSNAQQQPKTDVICENNNQASDTAKEEKLAEYDSKIAEVINRIYNQRSVSFNPVLQVCCVESRRERGPSLKDLYWHQPDYDLFKQEAVAEIRMYWKLAGTTAREAITALYQPEWADSPLILDILQRNIAAIAERNPSEQTLLALESTGQIERPQSSPAQSSATIRDDQCSNNNNNNHTNNKQALLPVEGTVMRHVDSLACLNQEEEEEEEEEEGDTDSEASVSNHSSSDSRSTTQPQGKKAMTTTTIIAPPLPPPVTSPPLLEAKVMMMASRSSVVWSEDDALLGGAEEEEDDETTARTKMATIRSNEEVAVAIGYDFDETEDSPMLDYDLM